MNKQIFCPNCGHANNADEKFCANCGQSLADVVQPTPPTENNTTSQAKTCPNCGQVVEAGTLFCENCGFNLANGHKATATNPSQTAPKTSKTQSLQRLTKNLKRKKDPVFLLVSLKEIKNL